VASLFEVGIAFSGRLGGHSVCKREETYPGHKLLQAPVADPGFT